MPRSSSHFGIFASPRLQLFVLAVAAVFSLPGSTSAALLDVWRADDLNLDDSDNVLTWPSASNRTASAVLGERPILRLNATPAGSAAVRFDGTQRMSVPASGNPVARRSAFSVAIVFRAATVGAGNSAQWWGKTGLVDAEEPGVTSDWGTVLTETGQVGIGTGNGDVSTYSTGASLVGTNYHVSVFTWAAGVQAVHVDDRPPVVQSSVSTAPRNSVDISFGGIRTGEANRRLNGDLVEIRFYDTALTRAQATNVIHELRDTHLVGNLPRIRWFVATNEQIYLGGSATLSWNVTNATSIAIDQGIGTVAASGTIAVSPTNTSTYRLTATNSNGVRSATVTVMVDPGVPMAFPITTNVTQDVSLALTLQGSDPNSGMLTHAIITPPMHGSLSGTPPNVTYTPTPGYFGFDSFTFKVNDGMFDSLPATVSIKVVAPPTAPIGIVLSSTNISASAGPGAFIATLRAIDPNEQDTHTFALVSGVGDNARFTLDGNLVFAGPGFAGGAGATFNIRLRATDSTGRSTEQTFMLRAVELAQSVVINEIHFNSPNNTIREEFVELHNPTAEAVDLSFWRVRGGIDYFLPANTSIAAGGFLVIAEDPPTVQNRFGVTALGPWSGGINNSGEEITLRDPQNNVIDSVDFEPEFPWPIAADGEGPSMQLVNPSLDNDLGSSWRSSQPMPGATNRVFATNAAPNIRQVNHTPEQPNSANQVVVTCKVTDPEGVAAVMLHYQAVNPGSFIPSRLPLSTAQLNSLNSNPALTNQLNPAFEATSNWVAVAMNDAGVNGDEVAGDSIYTVTVPQRANRVLVRYRITVTDTLGATRRAPFEDDPSLNFAYFVYDGIPAYLNFSPAVLQSLPIYTLITRDADLNQCTAWFNGGDQLPQNIGSSRNEGRLHFNWEGAVVYGGEVYDHVIYRLRGANGRYHSGKRSFRIRFKDGKLLKAKDQNGNRFPTKWRELTTGKGQSNRGSETFALNEVINYFLWNKVGVPAPSTFHFHFRVVRGAQETPTDRYAGDFWGLNWAQEKYDVNFLEAHGLPKGNLYKLVDNFVLGLDELRYQGPFAPTNAADFFNIENTLSGFQTTNWLHANANYTNWYRYHVIAEAIRHYDIWPSANKNGTWYFEPIYNSANNFLGRVMQLPYDGTDTWGPTWNNGEDVLFNGIFASSAPGGDAGQHPEMQKEYRNVAREIRELLFQPDQINAIIDAFAAPLIPFAQADHQRWLSAPSPANYSSLGIPSSPGVTAGLPGYVQDLKNFMFTGGNNAWWIDRNSIGAGGWVTRLDTIANDPATPARPIITYVGTNGFPADGLVFQSSPFSDPQGSATFAGMQWRVAEVLGFGEVPTNPTRLKLEWDAAWDSGELASFNDFITVPAGVVNPERLYRARVRHKDNTGRWSRWSAPVEFRPRAADLIGLLRGNLVFSEINYHPPDEGAIDGDEFEFIELKNIGTNTLDLTGLFFSSGVTFSFTNGTRLAPGAVWLLARNPTQLATRHPGVTVNGAYTGRLDNGGERLAVSHPAAGVIVELTYSDRTPWPVTPDGFGFTLVLADAATGTYRTSAQRFGSPGVDAAASALGGVVINEVLSSSTAPLRDSIELFNASANSVDIGGWYLTDDPSFPWKHRILSGTIIAPGSYLVFEELQFNSTPGIGTSFSLSSFGDDVYLFSADTTGELTGYSHGFAFEAAQDGVSFGRYVNSVGDEQFPLQRSRTFGSANSGPENGPVVINEIHYHPIAPVDEFVELRNVTASTVALYDPANPTNTWRINGLGYIFPAAVSIPASGHLLLVSGEPSAFRARWNVPAHVPILQFNGTLQDSGENLELQAPDVPTTNGVPYFSIDAVRYNDRRPWPQAADGAGASLQRSNALLYANDPPAWIAATPGPGRDSVPGVAPPRITGHPTPVLRTNAVGGTATFAASASGDPLFYQWRFKNDNIPGATNTTLTLPNVQLEHAGAYSLLAFSAGGSAESSNATLVVRVGVVFTNATTSILVRIRPDPSAAPTTNVTLRAGAVTFNPPVRYQWQFEGANIPDATNSTLTVTNVQLDDEGAYRVEVTDSVGPVLSAPTYVYPLIAPVLTATPPNVTAVPGELITVGAAATGNPLPFGWEWRRTSTSLVSNTVNERFSFLTFTNLNAPGSTNQYRVVVRTLGGGQANAVFNLVTLTDSDADGISDAWETQFGFSATNSADKDADFDLDGTSNYREYLAGTNPTNMSSFLRVNLSTATGQPSISFGAVSNRTYAIEFADQLGGPWRKLADIFAQATDRVEVIVDPQGSSNRFYRAVTPRQP